ncbi:guanine nucleotide exchange protein SMCR8-like [Menidia menidia]
MIGSPDLLAFTSSEGFWEGGEEQETQDMPEEFSVPLFPPSHPWTSRSHFHRDFILVAEFSEKVGPKPVLTIPDDPRVIGSFDLNHFSVRIMSVDYQASGPCLAPPASPGPRLNFHEDSKVILGDSAEDSFAYVHHLTLYDLEARGMVRPFCMAYVCSDQTKLMENFPELSAGFSQASDSLKTGNRQAFSAELQRKLQELEYKRLTLLQVEELQTTTGVSTGDEWKSEELEAVERSISNHRELLRQVTSYPNRKLKQPDFLPYDPADSPGDPAAAPAPEPRPSLQSSASSRSEHHLKPLQELCNAYFLSLVKEQLADTERRLRGDRSVLRTARAVRSLSRKLRLTNFLFELWSPEDPEEEELEGPEAGRESGREKGAEEGAGSEAQSTETLFSCVQEIAIKLVAGEARAATPDFLAAAEMTGSASSGDSIEVLGTERSYRTQQAGAGPDSRETLVQMTEGCVRRAHSDPGMRRFRTYAKRTNSEDSIEVLSTTESIFPDDLTAITEEEAEHHPLTNGFKSQEEPHTEKETLKAADSENEHCDEGPAEREDPLKQIRNGGGAIKDDSDLERKTEAHEDTTHEKMCTPQQAEGAVDSHTHWPELHKRVRPVPGLRVNFAPPAASESRPPPCAPLRLLSVDETSGSSDPPSPTQNDPGGARRDKRRRRKAALRALRFIRQHSFSQHAVYCLLSGRPLVVVGGDEVSVRKLVDALSLFLPAPGPDGGAAMPCLTGPLHLTDLFTWRLIGVCRSSSSSNIMQSLDQYSRYLALLDLDLRTLRSPSYSGSLVSALANPHTGIGRGITYLLHLEGCLTSLANQVLLHTFVPPLHAAAAAGEGDAARPGGLCKSESDLRVMRFLSDLILRRFAGRGPPVLRFSYSSVQLHKNTNAT